MSWKDVYVISDLGPAPNVNRMCRKDINMTKLFPAGYYPTDVDQINCIFLHWVWKRRWGQYKKLICATFIFLFICSDSLNAIGSYDAPIFESDVVRAKIKLNNDCNYVDFLSLTEGLGKRLWSERNVVTAAVGFAPKYYYLLLFFKTSSGSWQVAGIIGYSSCPWLEF